MASFSIRAVLAETQYPKVGAQSTGPIPAKQLIGVVEKAAKTGAEVLSFSLTLSWSEI